MKYLETEEEKKSFAITSALFALLFVLFCFMGLTYMDPPPENGIPITFGNSEFGMGEFKHTELVAQAQMPDVAPKEEDVMTQDKDDAVAVEKTEKKKEKLKQKPSKSTTDALSSLLNAPKSTGGKGDGNKAGDQGSLDGDPYSNSYHGSGGTGKGTNWGLNGRVLSNRDKVVQQCNESGTVVVQITVNKSGNVIAAKYTKGTTNTNPCLVEPALETARRFKWKADENAPEKQIGFIVVNFKVGE